MQAPAGVIPVPRQSKQKGSAGNKETMLAKNPLQELGSAIVDGPRASEVTEHVADVLEPHVDRAVLVLGLTYPLATAPQLYNVWVLGRTAGLSGLTSAIGLAVSCAWTVYGLLHKQKTIWMGNAAWIGVHASMVIGLLR